MNGTSGDTESHHLPCDSVESLYQSGGRNDRGTCRRQLGMNPTENSRWERNAGGIIQRQPFFATSISFDNNLRLRGRAGPVRQASRRTPMADGWVPKLIFARFGRLSLKRDRVPARRYAPQKTTLPEGTANARQSLDQPPLPLRAPPQMRLQKGIFQPIERLRDRERATGNARLAHRWDRRSRLIERSSDSAAAESKGLQLQKLHAVLKRKFRMQGFNKNVTVS